MLIFGYAADYEIRHVPTVVLDLDQSQESRDLVSRFTSSPYFDVQRQLTSSRRTGRPDRAGSATVGVEIHAGFAQELAKGQTAPVQVIVDATNSNTALIASGYIIADCAWVCAGLSAGPHARIAPQLAASDAQCGVGAASLVQPGASEPLFFVPGIIGSLTLFW